MTHPAKTTRKTFSRTTAVSVHVNATPERLWDVLTDAAGYVDWNSTIVKLEGSIEPGGKIQLTSTLDPKRTFKLRVKTFTPNQELVWGDAMGTRVFSIQPNNGGVLFSMTETIGGPLFPLFAKMIPDFDDAFNQFAADLKNRLEDSQAQ